MKRRLVHRLATLITGMPSWECSCGYLTRCGMQRNAHIVNGGCA